MKFGKRLRHQIELTLPEWRNKFLCYKELKKRLKTISMSERLSLSNQNSGTEDHESTGNEPSPEKKEPSVKENGVEREEKSNAVVEERFVRLLYHELEKFNNFFMEKEEEFVIRFHNLKERIEKLKSKCHDVSECEDCDDELNLVRKAVVSFHGEMILLENYSSLNYTGLVKILKKYDKRTGNLLRHPFILNVLRQPFYTTELLAKLIKSCEEEMLILFPISPGNDDNRNLVTLDNEQHLDSTPLPDLKLDHMDDSQEQLIEPGSENDAAVDDDYSMVYKSAVAALQSLQEIRTTSKTPHPLAVLNQDASVCTDISNVLNIKSEFKGPQHLLQVNLHSEEPTAVSIPDASSPTRAPLNKEEMEPASSNVRCSGGSCAKKSSCSKKSSCTDDSVAALVGPEPVSVVSLPDHFGNAEVASASGLPSLEPEANESEATSDAQELLAGKSSPPVSTPPEPPFPRVPVDPSSCEEPVAPSS